MQISVVIPTHNPRLDYLERTLNGLRGQTLPSSTWELIVIDNASTPAVGPQIDLSWHPNGRTVREEQLGLTAARLAGFAAAQGEIIILVDDDNVLAPDFLAACDRLGREHPFLGTWSGRVELVFEEGAPTVPALWRSYLTERFCESAVWSNDPGHNPSTPWGAGLCVRRSVAQGYRHRSETNPDLRRLDLQGAQLLYGGDTDIAYFGCELGLGKGVFPQLHLQHLIPARRCERAYLLRVIEGHAYSEWLHHWVLHKTVPNEPRTLRQKASRFARMVTSNRDARDTLLARERGHVRAARDLAGQQ